LHCGELGSEAKGKIVLAGPLDGASAVVKT
jgi:hypothetical protein